MAIQFVGTANAVSTAGLISFTVPLTGLTGGIASSPSENDVVMVITGWSGTTDGNPGVTDPASGVTEIADLYANDTNDANFSVSHFVCGASPPSTVTVRTNSVIGRANIGIVAVFRGVDTTTPIDVTSTTATGINGTTSTLSSITPTTTGACVVAAAMMTLAASSTANYSGVTGSGYTLGVARNSNASGSAASMAFAYKIGVTGGVSEAPGTFTNNGSGTANSWATVTFALRPLAEGRIKVWNGSSWVAKPVKVWNGSSWVSKPVKRWTGSAWVSTTY